MSNKLSKLFALQLTVSIFLTPLAGLSVRVQAKATRHYTPPVNLSLLVPPPAAIDLSTYVRIGRHNLPEPTRTTPPANSLLAQEASAVTYNWDTDSLFVVGDGGTSVVQVSKTGQLIDSMTLAPGGSPQNTDFYDPEGLSYVGSGKFVMSEERDRQIVLFTYAAGTTLTRANAQTVKIGTFVQNIGIEGLSWDPVTNGYICVKETLPQGIFQTGINFDAGTATNGSPTTENSTNLFNPALANLADFADVFALSNLPSLNGQPDSDNLLVLSQESGQIVNIDRTGAISSSLTIVSDPGNPLSVAAQQHEGLTMDRDGVLYVINENGGGDFDHPQLWVYAPSLLPNQPPTAVTLDNATTSIVENSSTSSAIKLADVIVADDGLGTNNLTITRADASFFELRGTSLFLKAGTVLDFESKNTYNITVNVDDTSVGDTPDASVNYTLSVNDQEPEVPPVPSLIISEVAPWSSGNSPVVAADWFEVTNTSNTAVDLMSWEMDDSSNSAASGVPLSGITSIAPGESVIFLEASASNPPATVMANFKSVWFGSSVPATLQVGTYEGGGVGLSTGGDAINLYDSTGALRANVSFGPSPGGPSFPTFDNWAGLNNGTISQLSVVGVHDAFAAAGDVNEIGSPGSAGRIIISEVAPWSSGNSPVSSDWFELTNTRSTPVTISGWKMDDTSGSPAAAVALNGITTIAPGESVVFLESSSSIGPAFKSLWFGESATNLQVGTYSGDGAGLGTGGDAVNIYSSSGLLQASVTFGVSPGGPIFSTFDNAAGLNGTTISQLSAIGVNGAFVAASDANEIGSPGASPSPSPTPTPTPTPAVSVRITEVAPWSSGTSVIGADWFEVTNGGSTALDLAGWKVDDNSNSFGSAIALTGVTNIAPGESAIFLESSASNPAATVIANFKNIWFGSTVPPTLKVGTYQGSGIGLGTGGDAVNLYDSGGALRANVTFGASPAGPSFPTFDNAGGLNNIAISQLSVIGTNGAFGAANDANEIGSPGTATPSTTMQFNVANVSVTEGSTSIALAVNRSGVTSETSTVKYSTNDSSASANCVATNGFASSRCDFLLKSGTLTFAAGETSKTIPISLVDDSYAEGVETFSVVLTGPTGGALGIPSVVTVQINDNETVNGTNPISSAEFFVRQHYLDFLNREPDLSGFNFWVNEITSCGADTECNEVKRVNVSAAFFLSTEFQETGYFVYRIYKSSFGNISPTPVPVRYFDFLTGTQKLGENVQVGIGDWETQLENNKQAFALAFVQRSDFLVAFPNSMTAEQLVNQLNANAGGVLSPTEKADLIAQLGATPSDSTKRAIVLRAVTDDAELRAVEFNRAFVLMQYFGYLRRNPNDTPDSDFSGFNFWLSKLDSFGGNFVDAEMVKAFILSAEYRQRFGP